LFRQSKGERLGMNCWDRQLSDVWYWYWSQNFLESLLVPLI